MSRPSPSVPNREAAEVPYSPVTLDGLHALEVEADFAAQVALDHVLALLNGMNNLRKLRFRQILGPNARINIGSSQDLLRIARPDAVNVPQRDFDALVRWNFNTNDACHK